MEQEQRPQPQVSIREILALASVVAVIALIVLINAHFATFRRWMEALFWAFLGVIAIFFVIVVLLQTKGSNIPTNRIEWYTWRMERAVNRVRRGRDDKKLSQDERELIEKIQNYYRDKISKLYDPD